jgi:thiol-disulfide isomerase/thioredoxin
MTEKAIDGSNAAPTPAPSARPTIAVLSLFALAACAAYLWYTVLAPAPTPVGTPAPAFALKDRAGKTVSLAAMDGKPVLLAFFGVACPPCREEIPHVEALARRYGDRLAVLLVNAWDDEHADVDAYARSADLKAVTVLYDGSGVAARYGVRGVPETVLIDPQGKIAVFRDAFDPHRPQDFYRVMETMTR